MDSSKPVITIKNLEVTYFLGRPNEVRALAKVNLEIYPGEFVIFYGPSGCGKSTLLYSISGLETSARGEIFIDEKDIFKIKNKEMEIIHQKKIGMIYQAYCLIQSLTAMQNIILPQTAIGVGSRERKAKALELMERFGVKLQANKYPYELSGGQQQRVAICRSIINDPEIILADEPVGNLDSRASDEVMNLLKDLNIKQNKTVILVTHNPAHLSMAHRVFYMKDGEIVSVKVNEAINEAVARDQEETPINISKDLELLARSFSSITSGGIGNLLVPFKAKQIVSEVLTGLTTEEVEKMEKKVEFLIMSGINDESSLAKYLDDSEEKGGMGFDKRVAEKLSEKVQGIIAEIKLLEKEDVRVRAEGEKAEGDEVNDIRHYLLETFEIKLEDTAALNNLNAAIKSRLENKIDKVGFFKQLDLSLAKGGVGLNRRTAKKVSKRLELLVLGKYK